MGQLSWHVKNSVTDEPILNDNGEPVEYDTEALAQTAAVYYTTTTGVTHVVGGPHPKPHA